MKTKARNRIIVAMMAAFVAGAAGSNALAGGLLDVEFDPANFSNPRVLDNPYWPLLPGADPTTFVYIGETEDGCTFNKVTANPADIRLFQDSEPGFEFYDGIMAQVVVDREWELEDVDCDDILEALDDPTWEPVEGLGELTFDWYIQDDDQSIWYMGEDSRDFGDECPSLVDVPLGTPIGGWPSDELFFECTEGSWEAGQLGREEGEIVGEAGIVVPGDFPLGADEDPLEPGNFWMQEVAEGAEDMAKILQLKATVAIEEGQFEGEYYPCRKTKEWTALEPGASVEHKFYCAGPGLLFIEGVGGGPTETEVLVLATP